MRNIELLVYFLYIFCLYYCRQQRFLILLKLSDLCFLAIKVFSLYSIPSFEYIFTLYLLLTKSMYNIAYIVRIN